ncbi:MAG TPA: hypothetical protein VE760_01095, partial [Acidimicrobiales bacterium]|nr:hypothetical protein [Acidimicrobiales bacterium]
ATLDPLAEAIGLFLDTMRSAFIDPGPHPLPPPDLGALREAGVPTVDGEEFSAALKGEEERRRLLAGLLLGDGWSAEGWRQRSARAAT